MQATHRASARVGVSSKPLVGARAGRRCLVVPNAVKDVFMPALSSTMTEGKIVSWLKSVGDKVKKGEALVVVESDKADMDVESFSEGILGAIIVQEGERASVGAPIAFVAENASELEEAKKKGASFGGAPAAAAPAAAAPAPAPAPVAAAPAPAPAAAPAPAPAPVAAAPAPAPRADGRIVATPYAKQLAKDLKASTGAILAVGGSKPTVVATADGMIGVRKVMNVNLTADHRIVYGADAAEFLQTLKAVIENPEQLTM
ncbi:Dihydrolipoyllysine-residue acetyltransferase [Tetrabaena socialis]|uniref:Dihydrolipoamide acetyltransferase component of pyruvate dehydrogenase complex n=1 Tax=Tetrabaena socialis TaxID=47790 RepID=A0A2J8AFC0_9CHLO|nr:Dihydrolipoyllysine-residue acetyltransferase [Tetrabaena socialis]|eukprot:PNH11218.1 Dihydrolipoyllysine-residue acetyltransferase [Tetrabaena socialis]